MRSLLSVSMPAATLKRLKKRAKEKKMSVSAYLVSLFVEDDADHLITEKELLAFAKEAEKEVHSGKTKKLRKAEDLLLPELP